MRIDEHSRIEEPPGIKRAFNRSQSRGKEFRTFLVIPPAMVTPNGVMMRNRPPGCQYGLGRSCFYRPELFEQRRLIAQATKGEVGRWPIWIKMGQTATDHSPLPSRLLHRSLCRLLDRSIKRGKLLPGDGCLKGIGDDAACRQFFAQPGHPQKALAPLPGSPTPVSALLVDRFNHASTG